MAACQSIATPRGSTQSAHTRLTHTLLSSARLQQPNDRHNGHVYSHNGHVYSHNGHVHSHAEVSHLERGDLGLVGLSGGPVLLRDDAQLLRRT
jgi:hypothetical protein